MLNNLKCLSLMLVSLLFFFSDECMSEEQEMLAAVQHYSSTYNFPYLEDEARSIKMTPDNGHIVVGYSATFWADAWIMKFDSTGHLQWSQKYGLSDKNDYGESIENTNDGGYITGILTRSYGAGLDDFWVIKLDSEGNFQWSKTYGGTSLDVISSIKQTSDGGYIVAGSTNSFGSGSMDIFILKLDSQGNIQWQNAYGGSNANYMVSIQQTADSGFIIGAATRTFGAGGMDLWIFKINSAGNFQWQKTYGGTGEDYLESIILTSDGGYAIAGYTESFGIGNYDGWILKLSNTGSIQWQKTYGTTNAEEIRSIQQTSDGGYIAAGVTRSPVPDEYDGLVFKLDSSGNVQWQKIYSSPGNADDYLNSIVQTPEGDYIAVGSSRFFTDPEEWFNELWILKFDCNGNISPSCDFINIIAMTAQNSNAIVQNTGALIVPTNCITQQIIPIPDTTLPDIVQQCSARGIFIQDIAPYSSPTAGGTIITVNGDGFTQNTKVILKAQGWEAPVDPIPGSITQTSLQFNAPAAPAALAADVCVTNCSIETCLTEALGYYVQSDNNYPFTPHIGVSSGFTQVTLFVPAAPPGAYSVLFDDIPGSIIYDNLGKLIAQTPSHKRAFVAVELCDISGQCVTLPAQYQYATFGYVAGQKSYLEVVDTDLDARVDFHPYSPGIQSQIMLSGSATASAFSIQKVIPGRYAFVAITAPDGLRISKIDTGTSSIVAQFFIADPMLYSGDIAIAEYYHESSIPAPIEPKYDLVVGANHLQIAGYFGGVIILDPVSMTEKQRISIPELSLGQILNIASTKDTAYLSTLIGPVDGPRYQLLVTLKYKALLDEWFVECKLDSLANITYPMPYFINLGIDTLVDPATNQEMVCLVAPEYDFTPGPDGALACSMNSCTGFNPIIQIEPYPYNPAPYPQDVTIGFVIDLQTGEYDWKAFVVDAATNKWTRVNGLLNADPYPNIAKDTFGITPVACEIRSNYDKVYIVNMNSPYIIPEYYDLTVINPIANNIKSGYKLSENFVPKAIAIQTVIDSIHFAEAAKSIVEAMPDSDFTNPSKRNVLLNKLDAIENLLGTPANEQAIISNAEVFENQVEKFIVNEARQLELTQIAEALIKSVQ